MAISSPYRSSEQTPSRPGERALDRLRPSGSPDDGCLVWAWARYAARLFLFCVFLALAALCAALVVYLIGGTAWQWNTIRSIDAFINTRLYSVKTAIPGTSIDYKCERFQEVNRGQELVRVHDGNADDTRVASLTTTLAYLRSSQARVAAEIAAAEETIGRARKEAEEYRLVWLENVGATRAEAQSELDAALVELHRAEREDSQISRLGQRGAASADETLFRRESLAIARHRVAQLRHSLQKHDVLIAATRRGYDMFHDASQNAARMKDLEHRLTLQRSELAELDSKFETTAEELAHAKQHFASRSRCGLVSPVDGYVWDVSGTTAALPGDELASVAAREKFFIEAYFDIRFADDLSSGGEVVVHLIPEGPRVGTIVAIHRDGKPVRQAAVPSRFDAGRLRLLVHCESLPARVSDIGRPCRVEVPSASLMSRLFRDPRR